MRHIVKYQLHGGTVPYFIQDGGYFGANGELVGVTFEGSMNCFIPKLASEGGELVDMTPAELVAHVVAIPMKNPMPPMSDMTNAEKTAMAQEWLAAKGF